MRDLPNLESAIVTVSAFSVAAAQAAGLALPHAGHGQQPDERPARSLPGTRAGAFGPRPSGR